MTLETAALGVLLPSFPGTTLARDAAELLEAGLGGLCLFGSNTADGPEAVSAYAAAVHSAAPDAVVAMDEEGGDVTRLHTGPGSPVLGPLALGTVDDLELTEATGRAIGAELAGLGITLDLGPVADVNSNPDNPVIGTRSFGSMPGPVAAHVAAWVTGLQSAGVGGCAKHFPGHGDTAEDSHLSLPVLDVASDVLEARELVPFAAAVEAGVAAVMTSHVVVPAIDPDAPATLSPAVQAMLRDGLGFGGVVVSDALDMAGASGDRGIPDAAVLAIAAGCDLLCIGADKDLQLVRAIQARLVEAVRSGELSEERLTDAAKRVGGLAATPRGTTATGSAALPGTARSVTVDGVLPSLTGARVVRVDSPATIAVGDIPWGLPADDVVSPGTTVLPDGPLVIQVRDAHRQPDVLATLGAAAESGEACVVVEWGWPGTRRDRLPTVHAHGWSQPGARAVDDVLRSAGWDR